MAKQTYPNTLPYPFSAAVRTGNLLFVSGQVGIRDGQVVDGGIEEQTRATMDNIRDGLAQAGATMEDERRLSVGITARFPVEGVAVAGIQMAVVVGLECWVELGHRLRGV